MSQRPLRSTLRAALLASVFLPACALAQADVTSAELSVTPETVLFEADEVTRSDETSPIIAIGNVRAYFGQRYLKADRLVYDPATDIVIAEGSVSITDENLQTAFAGRVELTGDLRDGIAENFSALLEDNARLAGDTAIREQGARTRVSKGVYTACSVCDEHGEAKTPTWRVKALRVTRDEERKVVRFRHAFIELKGVPILYTPFIQAPDPSVERQSGFLTPLIGASSRLGFNFELPYYLAISNSQDATFFPKYTSNDGVLWQGEYRRRDDSGAHVWNGGIINFDNTAAAASSEPLDVPGVRWHVFAKGRRSFGDNFEAGYDIERVSDDTYLRRYDVRRRGDLRQELDTSRTNRLRTNAYVNWTSGNSTLTANSYVFQGLRTDDREELTPYVLPLIDYRHDFGKVAGGDTRLNANFASLQRKSGVDTRRLTVSADWDRELFTPNGHRFAAFANLRGDLFHYSDLDEGNEITDGAPIFFDSATDSSKLDGRFAPTVGVEWSYPLTRRIPKGRLFIEPRVQLVASPADRNDGSILNEDSQSIEFDYTGLFDYNKATGFDAFEDGQRMNVGLAATAAFDSGITIEAEIGQQYRLQSTNAFAISTTTGLEPLVQGLGEKRSDFVGSLNLRYKNTFGIENRFQIDDDSGTIPRAESRAYLNFWRLRANASYVRLREENLAADLGRREELNARVVMQVTDHWSAGFAQRQDLDAGRTINQDFVIAYSDDCSLFEVTYRKDKTQDVGLGTDNALLFRFTLRSLVD